jgi:enamine deaminase RidA (YjgF/YER057c/UK114 family)
MMIMKKNLIVVCIASIAFFSCSPTQDGQNAQSTDTAVEAGVDVESKLQELNIQLSEVEPSTASIVKTVRVGNMVYTSGHGPDKPEGGQITGKVGGNLSIEEGREAARLTGIALLSSLKAEIGDLNKVKRVVKVLGMVNCTPDFTQQPQVINGFSDMIVEIFGENGRHARSAVGMVGLPNDIAVEIEMIVELKE